MTTGCHLFNVRPLFRRVLFIARRVANKKVRIGTLKSRRGPGWLAWLSWFRCCWLAEARLTVGVLAIYFAQANVNKVCIVSPKRSKDIYLCTHARDPQPALVKRVGSYIFIPFFFSPPAQLPRASCLLLLLLLSHLPTMFGPWPRSIIHRYTGREWRYYVPTNSNRVRFTIGLFVYRS